MNKTYQIIVKITLLVTILLLAGCTAQPVIVATQNPTPNLDQVRTEAVQAAMASLTAAAPVETATSLPTATDVPPTLPPPPQNTVAAPVVSTATPLPTATRRVSGGGGYAPAWTATPYTDRCQVVSSKPFFGQQMAAGTPFDAVWTVKNTGVRNWNDDFYFTFWKGNLNSDKVTGPVYVDAPVEKGETASLTVDLVAPQQSGVYNSTWALINDDGVAFCTFTAAIYVP